MRFVKILGVMVLVIAIAIVGGFWGTRNLVNDANAFLLAGFEERFDDAHAGLSPSAQSKTAVHNLAYLFYRNELTGLSVTSWTQRKVSNDVGLLIGTITDARGRESNWRLELAHDGEGWRVQIITPNSPEPILTVPGYDEIRDTAHHDMTRLAAAIRSGDFSPFLMDSAEIWKMQMPVDRLAESFRGFAAVSAEFSEIVASSQIVLLKPTINEQGVMRVEGGYGKPARLTFEITYFREKRQWRTLGISATHHQLEDEQILGAE